MLKRKILQCCSVVSLAAISASIGAQELGSAGQRQVNDLGQLSGTQRSGSDLGQIGSENADNGGRPQQNLRISNMPQDGLGQADSARYPSKNQALTFPPLKQNDFQKFVQESTGKSLKIFGADFFANVPSTFAPVQSTPVPSDYALGAGDEILIRGWGTVDINYRAVIDRNGLISIPTIGTIPLAGVKAGEAENTIREAVAKLYKGVNLNVSFGQLRAITVYVVGQARKPGSYTVSGYSTLVTALFASGGANGNGSLRRVQVKRDGKIVRELDLYNFIAKGDKSADIRLHDGDTIYIPAAGAYVALVGNVNTPAVYELRSNNDTVESILDVAGGLPVVADPRRATIERIDAAKNQPRSVEEFALDGNGIKKTLKNGDLISVLSITPEFSNAVTLRGNVDQALRSPFKSGMRISDLIPNREMLMTRASIRRQNGSLMTGNIESDALLPENGEKDNASRATDREIKVNADNLAERVGGGLVDEVNWDYAVIERIDKANLSTKLIPFNLGRALTDRDSPDNVVLQAGDTVTIFSQSDIRVPIQKRMVLVRVEGEVNVPGVYQMTSGDTLKDLIGKAGGATTNAYVFGSEFYRESVRKDQEQNLEKVIRKLEARASSMQANAAANITATGTDAQVVLAKKEAEQSAAQDAIRRMKTLKPTGRIAFALNTSDRSTDKLPSLKLENGDRLVIPSRPDFISVYGAVNQESSMIWKPGMTVGKYLEIAGPEVGADLEAVFVVRADGTILSSISNSWFSGLNSVEIMPGDSIVVPEKLDKETAYTKFVTGLKDWSQILSGFGITAAAIKSLRQ
jgi:protein involved in polysaccharide export with SLBB domain